MFATCYQDLISLFIICISFILIYFKWSYKYWKRKNIPYLPPKFPYGNLENPLNMKLGLALHVSSLYAEFKRKGWKEAGIFSITRPVYIPIHLDYVKNIMAKDFHHFMDRGLYYHEKTDPLSAHLFNIEGQKWRNLRFKLTPVFTSGKMKTMFQTVLDCGNQMKWTLDDNYLITKTFDIKEISACFTTDVIGSCAFGIECNTFKNPNSDFRMHAKTLFGTNMDRMIRDFLSLSFPKICKKMGMRLLPSNVTQFYSGVVKDVIKSRECNIVTRNDFIKLLLQIKDGDESLTFQEICAQAFLFFLAGFETSSSTMCFCLYQLALNSDIQETVRQEIDIITTKHEGKLSYESIQEMTYMTQVIEETLRMYPILPVLNRVCTKNYVLPHTNTILEKGTKILIPVYGIHHDPEYYPNPEKFNPDRFSAKAKAGRHSFAFLPFGEGPRSCIGLRFGMMQAKIGLAILISHYRFSLNPKTPQSLTINPRSLFLSAVENVFLDVLKI